jgi:hypothetical protein
MWSWSWISLQYTTGKIIPIWTSWLWQLVFVYICGNYSRSYSPWNLPLLPLFLANNLFWLQLSYFPSRGSTCLTLSHLLIPIKCVLLWDKPFFRYLCHCEKCRGFGLFVGTLLFWELAISFLLLWFICLNEVNLWACFFYSFLLNKLLDSFVGFCWLNHLLICSFDIIWTTIMFCHTFYTSLYSWCFFV